MDIHFVFLPHANDPESPVLETATKFKEIAGSPKAVLCVEAMGAGEQLWLSSRDTAAAPLALVQGLGSVRGAEVVCLGDDVDLASILFEMGLPAVRVATRPLVLPDEADDKLPAARHRRRFHRPPGRADPPLRRIAVISRLRFSVR